jgi:hypothetical protein
MAAPPPPAPAKITVQKKAIQVEESKKPTKSCLIISAQYFPFSNWIGGSLKEIKKVWLTTPSTKSDMDFGTLKSYDLIETFEDFALNNMVEERAKELNKTYHFTHVICLSEEDMLRTAILRDYFGVGGQSYENTLRFRDKVIMKTILQKKRIESTIF